MADASWGPKWPNCSRARIVTLSRTDGLRLPIHGELAPLVALLMDLTELGGYDIRPDWTWGYACRPIAGTTTASEHSQGTAVDVNAPANPRRKKGLPMVRDIPDWVVDLWKAHGFRWGGNYKWPDPMHLEFMGTVEQARATYARLVRFLSGNGGSVPMPPSRPGRPAARPYPGVIRQGQEGTPVLVWQQVLRERGYQIAADGIFGPATARALRDWQQRNRLVADGVGGPATWHSLLFA